MRIKPQRVHDALVALGEWRKSANAQAAQHLLPLLALLEKGVSPAQFTTFKEEDDRVFWDRYNRLPGESRPARIGNNEFQQDYYIDPLPRQKRAADHPHRGPSTIRDRTFKNSWKAAEEQDEQWKLSPRYAEIFETRVLRRAGMAQRAPIVDLAAWLFREASFPANSNAETLVSRFRQTFPLSDQDFERLFRFQDEPPDRLFVDEEPSTADYIKAIEAALIPSLAQAGATDPIARESVQDLEVDDTVLLDVLELLSLGSSGIILRGCPGTGKTWYAKKIAHRLVETPEKDIFQVQFHPAYGYEDFVEGYRPAQETKSGFEIVDKVFLSAVEGARKKTWAGRTYH